MKKNKKLSPCNVDFHLPMELVAEVLARLPVKSLMRYICVFKSWHSLISSPDFASLHFARFHQDHDDETTPVLTYIHRARTDQWMLRSSHTFNKITSSCCRNLHGKDFKHPSGFYPCGEFCQWVTPIA